MAVRAGRSGDAVDGAHGRGRREAELPVEVHCRIQRVALDAVAQSKVGAVGETRLRAGRSGGVVPGDGSHRAIKNMAFRATPRPLLRMTQLGLERRRRIGCGLFKPRAQHGIGMAGGPVAQFRRQVVEPIPAARRRVGREDRAFPLEPVFQRSRQQLVAEPGGEAGGVGRRNRRRKQLLRALADDASEQGPQAFAVELVGAGQPCGHEGRGFGDVEFGGLRCRVRKAQQGQLGLAGLLLVAAGAGNIETGGCHIGSGRRGAVASGAGDRWSDGIARLQEVFFEVGRVVELDRRPGQVRKVFRERRMVEVEALERLAMAGLALFAGHPGDVGHGSLVLGVALAAVGRLRATGGDEGGVVRRIRRP